MCQGPRTLPLLAAPAAPPGISASPQIGLGSPEALVLTLAFRVKADPIRLREVPFAFSSQESHHCCNNLLLAVV